MQEQQGEQGGGANRNESPTTIGRRALGRPPSRVTKRRAEGRNPHAHSHPNRPGRPKRGQISKYAQRMQQEIPTLKDRLRQDVLDLLENMTDSNADLGTFNAAVTELSKVIPQRCLEDASVPLNMVTNVISQGLRACHDHYQQTASPGRNSITVRSSPLDLGSSSPCSSAADHSSPSEHAREIHLFSREWRKSPSEKVSDKTLAAVSVSPTRAYDILLGLVTAVSADGVQCWMKSESASARNKPNYHLEMENPATGEPLKVHVHLGRLAAIAAGWGPAMLRTFNPSSGPDLEGVQTSHLCHNAECFNPRHMWVEFPKDNAARNTCWNRTIVQCTDSHGNTRRIIDPCRHSTTILNGQRCILPTVVIEGEENGEALSNMPMKLYPKQRYEGPLWGGLSEPCKIRCVPQFASEATAAYCIRSLRGEDVSEYTVLDPSNGYHVEPLNLAPLVEPVDV